MTYEEWLDEMGSAHEREVEESIAQQEQTNRAIALGRHSEQVWQQKNPGVDPYARWRGEA